MRIVQREVSRSDMVSFGPTLRGVHSPDERLLIPTVAMVWDHIKAILKNIPAKA